jgi:hypothetical protein
LGLFLFHGADITREEGYHVENRHFSHIEFDEKCIVEFGSCSIDASLVNISLKGATVKSGEDTVFRPGEVLRLSFHLGNLDFLLQFRAEVVRSCGNFAGVKFVEMDLDTMIHLRNLLEARTANPTQVRRELDLLVEGVR